MLYRYVKEAETTKNATTSKGTELDKAERLKMLLESKQAMTKMVQIYVCSITRTKKLYDEFKTPCF